VFRIELPNLEIALEHDRLAIVCDGRPQHATAGELCHLLRLAGGSLRPDILRAAAVRHEVEGAAIGHPHRPVITAVQVYELRVGAFLADPDLRLIEVAVAVAPPLGIAIAASRECDRHSVRRWRGL